MKLKALNFKPLFGCSSKHLQTTLPLYLDPGLPPPSEQRVVNLDEGDSLVCEVSTPATWQETGKTVLLVHGLGGSHTSVYMIRLARKLFLKGHKVVRINLRGAGSGKGRSIRPYCGGSSQDLFKVLQSFQNEFPFSDRYVIGFSLGGNIAIKMAGELGKTGINYFKGLIAICAPLDLGDTVRILNRKRNSLYHHSYLKSMLRHSTGIVKSKIKTMYEYDQQVTAPLWGFQSAEDYYLKCSSIAFLSKIQVTTHLLFAEDDPFVNLNLLKEAAISPSVNLWSTKWGGHMGFIGRTAHHQYFWMDQLLLNWIHEDFTSDLHL